MTENNISEADVAAAVGQAFGRGGDAPTRSVMVDRFREAGLCQESAEKAARGLESGVYFSFEDAAMAQTVFDGGSSEPRNRGATPRRIAEVAKSLQERS